MAILVNPLTGQELTLQAFCPTGQGGGKDNSCPPNKGGSARKAPEIWAESYTVYPEITKTVKQALAGLPAHVAEELRQKDVTVAVVEQDTMDSTAPGCSAYYDPFNKKVVIGSGMYDPHGGMAQYTGKAGKKEKVTPVHIENTLENVYHEIGHALDDGSGPYSRELVGTRSDDMPLGKQKLPLLLNHYNRRTERFAQAYAIARMLASGHKIRKNNQRLQMFMRHCPKEIEYCRKLIEEKKA